MTKKQARRAKRMRCTKEFMIQDTKPDMNPDPEVIRKQVAKEFRQAITSKREASDRKRITFSDIGVLDTQADDTSSKRAWLEQFKAEVKQAQAGNEEMNPSKKAS